MDCSNTNPNCENCPFKGTRVGALTWPYIAGLFDGEGCLSIQPRVCMLSISNRHLQTLEELQSFTGVGRITVSGSKTLNKRTPCYEWKVSTNGVRKLLPLMLPYLRINRHRAEAMLEYLAGIKLGNNLITSQEAIRREKLKQRINGRLIK